MTLKIRILCVFLLFLSWQRIPVNAQVIYPGSYEADYYELLQIKNYDQINKPIFINPAIITQYSNDSTLNWDLWSGKFKYSFDRKKKGLNVNLLKPRLSYVSNSRYPRGYNDGPVWMGRGSNANVTGGLVGNIGILHFSFAPVFSYSQNNAFYIPSIGYNKSPYSYPFEGKIDWVQRYGDNPYYNFHLGQSEIRLIYKNATIGLSTENISWGPSRYNPILLSNNAGGFPHLDIGTARPVQTKIGRIEYKAYWGELMESDYFDDDSSNDRKYITGWIFGYEPKWIKGFRFGFSRIMYTKWLEEGLSWEEIFAAYFRNTHNDNAKNDEYDQMMSLMLKYSIPQAGFEAYLEYARNDFPANLTDLFEHPDRSRARTIGVMKFFEFDNGNILKFVYENSVLSANQTQIVWPSGSPTYYVHSVVPSGYTHDGQLVGAGIGPGSNADVLKVYLYRPTERFGFEFQRTRFNDDYFVNAYAYDGDLDSSFPTDFEVSFGIDYVKNFDKFSLHPEFMVQYRKNFYYQNSVDDIFNFMFGVQVSYNINKSQLLK